jgi:excisionase family DNA binding protein
MNDKIIPIQIESKLLRAVEVAEILNISRAFVYQLMQTGELPTVRLGRSVRVRPSDLQEVIRSNTCKGNSK